MFIKNSQRGYSRSGDQFARGSFLLVFSHNQFKWEDQNNRPHPELHGRQLPTGICQCAGSAPTTYQPGDFDSVPSVPSYYLRYCPAHSHEYKVWSGDNRKLYACVRHVSLRQCGHWMMGTAKIAGQSLTVSGSYGGDGLPMDYEDLTPAAREKLVELPKELADEFWAGGGHNCAGNEAFAMRDWALKVFKGNK